MITRIQEDWHDIDLQREFYNTSKIILISSWDDRGHRWDLCGVCGPNYVLLVMQKCSFERDVTYDERESKERG